MRNILISLILILLFSGIDFGQTKAITTEYTFPQTDSEFTVVFPEKPDVRTLPISLPGGPINGESIIAAEYSFNDGSLVRVQIKKLTPQELEFLMKKDDTALAEGPKAFGTVFSYEGPIIKVGKDSMGRYATLRGNITFPDNTVSTSEVIYRYGKSELIILYGICKASEYPTPSISKLFDSLKLRK